MTTTTILVLLVTLASTIAFVPPAYPGARRRRDVASASKSGSGAVSFSSSGSSSSGSSAGPGYSTSISSRSGIPDSGQGLNSVNPGGVGYSGAGDFSYPNYANNQYQGGAGYMPADFHTLFMQYLDFMQRMSQQQAYAPNGGGYLRPGSSYISWAVDGTSASPSIPTTSVAFSPYYQTANLAPTAQYYATPVSSAQYYTPYYYTTPVSTSKYFYKTDNSASHNYNNHILTSQYYNTPSSTYKYYSTPVSTVEYSKIPSSKLKSISTPNSTSKRISTPNSTTKRISTRNISTRQLLPAFNTLSTIGQPALQHYSRSTASVSFNGGGISSRSAFFGGDDYGQGGFYFPGQGYSGTDSGDGHVSASASAGLSPRGGFGSASISPPPQGNPELGTRMGSFPASGGGNFAVYSSSSSGSTDVNGVRKTFKEASSVVNDNGKVTTFHVRDP